MYKRFSAISLLCIFISICTISAAQAQFQKVQERKGLNAFQALINKLTIENCSQDLPAPKVLAEPQYTQGSTNIIRFELPAVGSIPFSVEDIRVPFVITLVGDDSGEAPLQFPRPIKLQNDSTYSEIILSLNNEIKYSYTTALFIPVCKIDCDAVTDSSQLELHCSAYRDTVWSIQDTDAPLVENVHIPQLDATTVTGWWNKSTIQIKAQISDPAGVWQGFLYMRTCGEGDWKSAVADTTFSGDLSATGFVFSKSSPVTFEQKLADGCYEFRIEGKDAAHTPESSFPNFQLAGNGGEPQANAPATAKIKIDTTPPASVSLNCDQRLNSIQLTWTASVDPEPGIGIAGYHIFRNAQFIKSVAPSELTFLDNFSAEQTSTEFQYQIQPFDSLGNVQTEGGLASCLFRSVPQIVMLPEPEFTAGDSNEVCWHGSALIKSFSLFIVENADFNNTAIVEVTDTCFTFHNLKDGAKYSFWLKATDELGREVFSDTVASTQDATLPEVVLLEVLGTKLLNNQQWSTAREVQLRFVARDYSPGVVQNFQIFENAIPDSLIILQPRAEHIDSTMMYMLKSKECVPVELAVAVRDGAGNESIHKSVMLYLDTAPPEPVTELNCEQMLNLNGIQLSWLPSSEPADCSGLAGYRIYRNENVIATVAPEVISYIDTFPADTPSQTFMFQVLPFDSLNNLQLDGAIGSCDFVGRSKITLRPLPKFTQGLRNELCWQVSGSLVSLNIFLDENGDAVAEDSVLFMNSTEEEMCYLFQNLKDGQKYYYWITGVDEQQRFVSSDTVHSIQDNSKPVIDDFAITEAELLDNQFWIYKRDIQINLLAHDSRPGEIWDIEIYQDGISRLQVNYEDSTAQLNKLISVTLLGSAQQSTPIELSVQVFDGANNFSEVKSIYLHLQENLPDMIGFPNPFNPIKNKITIRLDDTHETEIKIYDFFGNLVQTLNEKVNPHDFSWDGRNGEGEMVANGGYICVGTKTGTRFKIGVKKQAF